jgi:peptide/nickel transport system substrate-binding protein
VTRYLKFVALVGMLAIAAAACGGGGGGASGPSGPSATGGQIQAGGTLHGSLLSDIDAGFDPGWSYYSVTWEFYRCCLLRTLLSYNGKTTAEGGANLQPDIATDLPQKSADGLTWTFTLKSGIHYGDPLTNVEVTAQDFVRAMEREADPNVGGLGYNFYYSVIKGFDDYGAGKANAIEGIQAPDDHTFQVTTTEPIGYLPYLFAMAASAPIPPNPSDPNATLGIAEGHTKDFGRFFVATGPYEFAGSDQLDFSQPASKQTPVSGYQPGKSIQMVRNPGWDASTDDLRPAYPNEIDVTIGGNLQDEMNKISAGELDVNMDSLPPPQTIQQYSTDPSLQPFLHINPSDAVRYLEMNLAQPPFDDIHVRKAVNLALDKDGMRKLRGGASVGEIAGHIMVDSLENNILKDYDPYATPNGAGDIEAAKAEMKQSKYDTNGDGVCDADVCKNVLAITDEADPYPKQAVLIQQNLEPLGITLDVKSFERTTMYNKCGDPNSHDGICLAPAWGKDFPDGTTFGTPLFGSSALFPACCNRSMLGASPDYLRKYGYSVTNVPSVDDQIAQADRQLGDARFQAWADLDKTLMEQIVPWVPYLFDNNVEITSQRIVHYSFDQFAGVGAWDQLAIAPSQQ